NSLPPDLLIVLDRSGSMNEDSMGVMCRDQAVCGATTKWTQMTTAINQVVMQTQDKVRWGLKFFASPGGGGRAACTVNAMADVPVAPANAAAVAAAIADAANAPGSNTPTNAAETQAAAYLLSVTDPNPKYILLATDGLPNCAGGNGNTSDEMGAIMAVADVAAMGFPTFVIGIATNAMADGTLNMMAVNGGHPRTGMPQQYYPVSTSADLTAALGVIQGMVALPCQFQLGGVPSDLTAVKVTVGGKPVASTDWTYGPGNRSIVFPDAGATCTGLKSGALKDVVINLPCGAVIIK
ncbi:MAG: vWA domain-containing protein, partial [Myxococcales bacterium]